MVYSNKSASRLINVDGIRMSGIGRGPILGFVSASAEPACSRRRSRQRHRLIYSVPRKLKHAAQVKSQAVDQRAATSGTSRRVKSPRLLSRYLSGSSLVGPLTFKPRVVADGAFVAGHWAISFGGQAYAADRLTRRHLLGNDVHLNLLG